MRYAIVICTAFVAGIALTACTPQGRKAAETSAAVAPATDIPAGVFSLDKTHASLIFRVSHLGMSNYTARFTGLDAQLTLDPKNPDAASVSATIDPRSLTTDYPDPKVDFDAELAGPSWLDAGKFPQITFRSTKIEMTGVDTARMTGDLGLHGVTQPVILDVKYNGGYAGNAMDPGGSRIGFSAHGSLKRSAFGVAYGVPAPGSNFGVGDDVEVIIEAEFVRPLAASKPST